MKQLERIENNNANLLSGGSGNEACMGPPEAHGDTKPLRRANSNVDAHLAHGLQGDGGHQVRAADH
jgi:hypothetical protein